MGFYIRWMPQSFESLSVGEGWGIQSESYSGVLRLELGWNVHSVLSIAFWFKRVEQDFQVLR